MEKLTEGDEGKERGPWKFGEKLSSSCSGLKTLLPFLSRFMKQQQCPPPPPPYPPPRELLLPQDIPEMHSRGVGQLGVGWGWRTRGQIPARNGM